MGIHGVAPKSKDSDERETPQSLFDELNKEFNFTLDVCASSNNTKCTTYFSKDINGLSQEWVGVCWMNPPYSNITPWVKKAYESITKTTIVVCLVPSATDTRWWHDYAMKGEIRFIKGRLKFNKLKYCAPFPSTVIIYRRS